MLGRLGLDGILEDLAKHWNELFSEEEPGAQLQAVPATAVANQPTTSSTTTSTLTREMWRRYEADFYNDNHDEFLFSLYTIKMKLVAEYNKWADKVSNAYHKDGNEILRSSTNSAKTNFESIDSRHPLQDVLSNWLTYLVATAANFQTNMDAPTIGMLAQNHLARLNLFILFADMFAYQIDKACTQDKAHENDFWHRVNRTFGFESDNSSFRVALYCKLMPVLTQFRQSSTELLAQLDKNEWNATLNEHKALMGDGGNPYKRYAGKLLEMEHTRLRHEKEGMSEGVGNHLRARSM